MSISDQNPKLVHCWLSRVSWVIYFATFEVKNEGQVFLGSVVRILFLSHQGGFYSSQFPFQSRFVKFGTPRSAEQMGFSLNTQFKVAETRCFSLTGKSWTLWLLFLVYVLVENMHYWSAPYLFHKKKNQTVLANTRLMLERLTRWKSSYGSEKVTIVKLEKAWKLHLKWSLVLHCWAGLKTFGWLLDLNPFHNKTDDQELNAVWVIVFNCKMSCGQGTYYTRKTLL